MDHYQIDTIIDQLSGDHPFVGRSCESLIQQLCPVAVDIFSAEPTLLELQAPIWITGDGEDHDLRTSFRYTKSKHLYLGNYGGHPKSNHSQGLSNYGGNATKSNHLQGLSNYFDQRGNCLPKILLLLAFKIRYPNNIFLLNGNLNAWNPLFCVDEVDEKKKIKCKISSDSESILYDCLDSLPVAALINDKIICTYGGMSSNYLFSLDQIRNIKRPKNFTSSRFLLDLIGPHSRIVVAKELQFLEEHDLRLICHDRHQAVAKKDFAEHRVVSISPSYRSPNVCMMIVDANLECSFLDAHRRKKLWSYQILMPSTIQNESLSGANYGEESPLRKVAETSKPDSRSGTGRNPYNFEFGLASLFRNKASGVKPTERNISKVDNGSNHSTTITTKAENSPGANPSMRKPASKNRNVSPGFMPESMSKSNTGSTNVLIAMHESSQEARPFDFDPTTLYRSKSPGVKRFIGARV